MTKHCRIKANVPQPSQYASAMDLHLKTACPWLIQGRDSHIRGGTTSINEAVAIPCHRATGACLAVAFAILIGQYAASSSVSLHSCVGEKPGSPLRLDVAPDTTITELLDCVRRFGEHTITNNSGSDEAPDGAIDQGMTAAIVLGEGGLLDPRTSGNDRLGEQEACRIILQPNEEGTKLYARLQYSNALDSDTTAERVIRQFVHIAHQIQPENGGRTLQQLDLLPRSDHQTLADWMSVSFPPQSVCLHDMVAAHALRAPSAPAISAWDGELTYRELDRLSGRLAVSLRGAGVGRGMVVPILFEKSMWTVVTVLAIHQAGGACVSICQSHPDSFIEQIVTQLASPVMIASETQASRLRALGQRPLVVPQLLKDDHRGITQPQTAEVQPQDLAFVIFTSGSTGKPKGVRLTHEAISTSAHYHGLAVDVRPTSRVLQLASYAFDMSVIETWYALARGGCLCIPSESERLWDLPAFVDRHRASWAFFTPTMLRGYRPTDFAGRLTTIALGGENVTRDLVDQWSGHVRLFDLWGPAETAGAAGCEIVPGEWIPGTFGRGAGCHLWITSPENSEQLLGIGAVGEVVIEGHIVGQGYLHDPVRTANVFIAAPSWRSGFSTPVEGRFYKTGDLGQYNPDGTVRYVARKDTMVKINGQRVDVDAVEVAIRTLDPTRQAAVDAVVLHGRENRSNPVLLAFVETQAGAVWADDLARERPPLHDADACLRDAAQLQAQLTSSLPRWMVPTFVIPLLALPRGATSKVDKKRLRASVVNMSYGDLAAWLNPATPIATPSSTGSPVELPHGRADDLEQVCLEMVARALEVDASAIRSDASFRQLGGDSISAIHLIRALAEDGLVLRMPDLLGANWKIRDLAQHAQVARKAIPPAPAAYSLLPDPDLLPLVREILTRHGDLTWSDVEDVYPCTPLQEGLLSMSTASAPGAYVDRYIFSLPPGISLDQVQHAWETVVRLVPVLRTRIVHLPEAGSFQAVICVRSVSWTDYDGVEDFLEADARLPMEFGTPLLRLSRITGGARPAMAVSVHHAIYDGWTFEHVLHLVEEAYRGVSLAAPPAFAHFVQYHQQHDPAHARAMEAFWRTEMDDLQPITYPEFPTASYRPRASATVQWTMPAPPRSSMASPTARLQLAWALLLSLYGDQDDIVFGLVMDGRHIDLPGIETLAGPTISTVPVRTRVPRDETVGGALAQIDASSRAMKPFLHSGLQHIARASADAAAACQFRSLLVVQSEALDARASPILGCPDMRLGDVHGFPGYGLVLIAHPLPLTWTLELCLDETLVSRPQALRMLEQLGHLLPQLDAEHIRLRDLSLLSPADEAQLRQWKATPVARTDRCVHELIAQRAATGPDAVGVAAWDGDLTYRELDQLSSRLAATLRSRPGPPQSVVGLLFPRSRWVMVAMLAALKAGRPFVMLDRQQTPAHHADICARVQVTDVLTAEETQATARSLHESVYVVNGSHPVVNGAVSGATETAEWHPTSRDVAYIVFTSGSTGRPKGVAIEHGQFAAATLAQRTALSIRPDSRMLHLSSYAFDSFAVEILTTLCAGGCVCVPSDAEVDQNIALAVRRYQATCMMLTPSTLRLIEPEDVPSLRTLIAVGESLLPAQAARWAPRLELLCGYGPTECCTGASVARITVADHGVADVRRIGAGMGAHLWVVDRHDHERLVPLGAVGELLIEGPIVGRGYLDEPELTAAAFLDQTAWQARVCAAPPGRLYKTGDLARYNDDGTCTFLGRKNQQTKLRGQRLDLTAVEQHLVRGFAAEGAVVVAVAAVVRPPGHAPLLVAMVHLADDPSVTPVGEALSLLRQPSAHFQAQATRVDEAMRRHLPLVLVPSVFLQLQRLPLTSTGKLNRPGLLHTLSAMPAAELLALHGVGTGEQAAPLARDEDVAQTLSGWLAQLVHQKTTGARGEQPNIAGYDVVPARLGLDSIDLVALSQMIARQYHRTIPATVLGQAGSTVRTIGQAILQDPDAPVAEASEVAWADYRRLSAAIDQLPATPVVRRPCQDPDHHRADLDAPSGSGRRVFLTGATGFLGSRVLHQLVASPDVEAVVVLVRAASAAHGMRRIVRAAQLAHWWRDSYHRGIEVWPGDLTQPQLGLSDTHWAILRGQSARGFDAIVHNGATVHWVYDYVALQAANVQSTFELLSALHACPASVQLLYVSALRPGEQALPTTEAAIRDSLRHDDAGYSQTKLVSELLLARYARAHPHPLSIVRPGLMMGDPVPNVDDMLWRTVAGALRANAYNAQEVDSWIFLAPVDWVATTILHDVVYTSRPDSAAPVRLTSVEEGLWTPDFWHIVMSITRRTLRALEGPAWLAQVQQEMQSLGADHPLWPVADYLAATGGCIGASGRKDGGLSPTTQSMIWMAVARNIRYLDSHGFLDADGETGRLRAFTRATPMAQGTR